MKKLLLGALLFLLGAGSTYILLNALERRSEEPSQSHAQVTDTRRDISSTVLATGIIKPMVGAEVQGALEIGIFRMYGAMAYYWGNNPSFFEQWPFPATGLLGNALFFDEVVVIDLGITLLAHKDGAVRAERAADPPALMASVQVDDRPHRAPKARVDSLAGPRRMDGRGGYTGLFKRQIDPSGVLVGISGVFLRFGHRALAASSGVIRKNRRLDVYPNNLGSKGGKLEASQEAERVELVKKAKQRFARILHVGPYAEEPRSIAQIDTLLESEGLSREAWHVEVYLSDPNRTAPEKLKTVLLVPISG